MNTEEMIKEIQEILNVTVDGIIGPKTLFALETKLGMSHNMPGNRRVHVIQEKVGASPDGIFGPKTAQAILDKIRGKELPVGLKTVTISIGHSIKDQGAESSDGNVTEYQYNKQLADCIKKHLNDKDVEVHIVNRFSDAGGTGMTAAVKAVNKYKADCIVELHANAYNGSTSGCETLFWHTYSDAKKLAQCVQKEMIACLGNNDRGVKSRSTGDRGAALLRDAYYPCIITEPFFIDNNKDLSNAIDKMDRLGKAIATGIINFLMFF